MWVLEVHVECKKAESRYSHQIQQTTLIFTKKKKYFYVNTIIYQ